MLDKYIKAFEKVKCVLDSTDAKWEVYKELNILEEVVNKFTPKKPKYYREEEWGSWCECPNCHCAIDYGQKICDECDQSIDWSDDE